MTLEPNKAAGGSAVPAPPPGHARRVIALAWPVITQNLLETLVGVIDTLLVARLGAAAIAGVGTAVQVVFFLLAALSAVTIGASIVVAHAVGAGGWSGAQRVAKQAIVWGALTSLPLALVGALAAPALIGAFGVDAPVAAVGAAYLRVSMVMLPALLLVFVSAAVLRGAGDTRTPLMVSLLANVINGALAYGLIYGQFGLPQLGAVGSAWAAATGRIVAAAILLLVLIRGIGRGSVGRGGLSLRGRQDWWPRFAAVRQVLTLGIPAAIEQILISAAFTTLTIIVAGLGTQQLATQRITFNALSLAFLPGFGFSIAASTLVGQSLGAGKPDEAGAAARAAAGWAVVWMGLAGALYFLFAGPLIGLFTDDPAVIDLGARSLRALALSQPFWGLIFVWSGALRGAGNTRYPLVANSLGLWAVVALSVVAVTRFAAELPVLWAFFIPCSALNALAVWLRFRRGDWRTVHDR